MEESLEAVGAVDFRRLMVYSRHVLQARQKDNNQVAAEPY